MERNVNPGPRSSHSFEKPNHRSGGDIIPTQDSCEFEEKISKQNRQRQKKRTFKKMRRGGKKNKKSSSFD